MSADVHDALLSLNCSME